MATSIHPGTTIGAVRLMVPDIDPALNFYTRALGMEVLDQHDGHAVLGASGASLVELEANRHASRAARTAGLYHFAILFPSRRDLAVALKRLLEHGTRLQGAADHSVSESVYFSDVDGNGLEIYRDRPRSEWVVEDGEVRMTVDPLDMGALLAETAGEAVSREPLPAATRMGHIHLRVSAVEASELFYCRALGFDLMARFGRSASFVAAGGYHHHIAFNVWQGAGLPAPPPDSAGLRHFTVRLPGQAELERLVQQVHAAGLPAEDIPEGVLLTDPSGIRLVLTT